jgi:hypothetical protein
MNAAASATATGVAITSLGVYRAGGGGAGNDIGDRLGGPGGGGTGATLPAGATNGAVNTGGGAGGSGGASTGLNGGSGIVILRYSSDRTITLGAGLTGTTSTIGANKVTVITAGTDTVTWN